MEGRGQWSIVVAVASACVLGVDGEGVQAILSLSSDVHLFCLNDFTCNSCKNYVKI